MGWVHEPAPCHSLGCVVGGAERDSERELSGLGSAGVCSWRQLLAFYQTRWPDSQVWSQVNQHTKDNLIFNISSLLPLDAVGSAQSDKEKPVTYGE